jgi:hypothetical protein
VQGVQQKPSELKQFEAYLVRNFPLTSAMSYCIAKYVERRFIEGAEPPDNVVCIESINK